MFRVAFSGVFFFYFIVSICQSNAMGGGSSIAARESLDLEENAANESAAGRPSRKIKRIKKRKKRHIRESIQTGDAQSREEIRVVDVVIVDPSLGPDLESLVENGEPANQILSKAALKKAVTFFSDGIGASSAGVVLASYLGHDGIGLIGPRLLAAHFALSGILQVSDSLDAMRTRFGSLECRCRMLDLGGHLVATTGFGVLGAGLIEPGSWMVTGGLWVKSGSLAIRLSQEGMQAVFGNDHTIRNILFRITLLSGAGTVGATLLALGSTLDNHLLDVIGGFTIGAGVGLASLEVLVESAIHFNQACYSYLSKGNLTPSVGS